MPSRSGGRYVLRGGKPVRVEHSGGTCNDCQAQTSDEEDNDSAPVTGAENDSPDQEPDAHEDA